MKTVNLTSDDMYIVYISYSMKCYQRFTIEVACLIKILLTLRSHQGITNPAVTIFMWNDMWDGRCFLSLCLGGEKILTLTNDRKTFNVPVCISYCET